MYNLGYIFLLQVQYFWINRLLAPRLKWLVIVDFNNKRIKYETNQYLGKLKKYRYNVVKISNETKIEILLVDDNLSIYVFF